MLLLQITESAASRIRYIVHTQDALGIRLGVKKGGCAGMEYTVDTVTVVNALDEHVEQHGVHVYVAPEAVLFLFGTELDFETDIFRSGFVFRNPNQTSACGCGESVELKPVDGSVLENPEFIEK